MRHPAFVHVHLFRHDGLDNMATSAARLRIRKPVVSPAFDAFFVNTPLAAQTLPSNSAGRLRGSMHSLAAGDTCATGTPLTIASSDFIKSTACYKPTTLNGIDGLLFSETGVPPTTGGEEGWGQAIVGSFFLKPSTSSVTGKTFVSAGSTPNAFPSDAKEVSRTSSVIPRKSRYLVHACTYRIRTKNRSDINGWQYL